MKISIIGSGNVATNLAIVLKKSKNEIVQVYSRKIQHATFLAKQVNAELISQLENLKPNADVYIICVSDKSIEQVSAQIPFDPLLIAHTSGSMPISILSRFKNFGVFYPIQTFSKQRVLSFSEVPICIEANTPENQIKLEKLAKTISGFTYSLDSVQRKQCHLAAVFANNFVNHFYVIAHQLLKEKELPFELLKPLILETAQKVQSLNPIEAQTGPAVRNDEAVIETHLKQLKSDKFEKLYRFVTESIREYSTLENPLDSIKNQTSNE